MSDNDIFEVEKILKWRHSKTVCGQYEYLIRWQGYDESDDTWEIANNLIDASLIADAEQLRKSTAPSDGITNEKKPKSSTTAELKGEEEEHPAAKKPKTCHNNDDDAVEGPKDRAQGEPQEEPACSSSITDKSIPQDDLSEEDSLSLWKCVGIDPDAIQMPPLKGISPKSAWKAADFFLFVYERQQIWKLRNEGWAGPWTKHPHLRDKNFCNIYRELDRGTCFFHAHVLDLKDEFDNNLGQEEWLKRVLWASFTYRQVNRVSTFLRLGIPKYVDTVDDYVTRVQNDYHESNVFFTAAHQTAGFDKYIKRVKEVAKDGYRLLNEVVDEISLAKNLCQCYKSLKRLPGIGNFSAWQIICDLKESKCLPGDLANDDFCALGPGALDGLELIFPDKKGSKKSSRKARALDLARALVNNQETIYDALGLKFPYWQNKRLGIKEIEHALCEYQKLDNLSKGRTQQKTRKRNDYGTQLDNAKPCHACHQGWCDGLFCDMCLNYYCGTCSKVPPEQAVGISSWICPRCKEF